MFAHKQKCYSVDAFIAAYPVMKQNGWNITSVAQLANAGPAWQNSPGYGSSVQPATDVIVGSFRSAASSASSASAGATASQSTTEYVDVRSSKSSYANMWYLCFEAPPQTHHQDPHSRPTLSRTYTSARYHHSADLR